MGLLTNLIDAELTKKRDERVAKLNAYASMLGMPDDKVAPEKKNQYLQLLTGEAPKGGKDLLQLMGPHLLKMGGKSKTEQTAQKAQESPGDADLVSPDPNAPKKPAASEGSGGPFRSTEEQEAMRDREEKRKNALEIEKSTREYEAKKKVDILQRQIERQQDQQYISETLKARDAGNITEEEAQYRIGKGAPADRKPERGVMIMPNGQKIYGVISQKDPNILLIPTGDPNKPSQPLATPAMGRLATVEEYEKESKPPASSEKAKDDQRAFDAYKERHNIPTERKLTASEEQKALAEGKQGEESPDTKALREATLESTRERIRKEREERSTTPKEINPGTREYRIAQDLAYGRLTMQEFRSLTAYSRDTNKKMDIYDKATQLNPAFNPATFEMGYKLASNPRVQQQLASLDNVKMGVDDLLKASDAATRTGSTLLNKAVIPGGIAIGNKKYSNFATARTAFADELSGALGYGSATDMSREMGFSMTDANLSPEAFRSAIQDIVMPFVERKKASLLHQMGPYGEQGMNPSASPDAGVQRPAGAKTVNTKADYDALPKGAKYIDSQDGKTYTKSK